MTEQQPARTAKRRLTILRHAEEITGRVSLTCRYYGISKLPGSRLAEVRWGVAGASAQT